MSTIELNIEGMSCSACVSHVTKALESVPGVSSAQVDLNTRSAQVTGEALSGAALVAAVEEEGYNATQIESK